MQARFWGAKPPPPIKLLMGGAVAPAPLVPTSLLFISNLIVLDMDSNLHASFS